MTITVRTNKDKLFILKSKISNKENEWHKAKEISDALHNELQGMRELYYVAESFLKPAFKVKKKKEQKNV